MEYQGGGVNYLEHASPHDYQRGGSAIFRMEQVIQKFREYEQTPTVYLFRIGLDVEIKPVIDKLLLLGLVDSGNVFFCNISGINIYNTTNYIGIYNNKWWFVGYGSTNEDYISGISVNYNRWAQVAYTWNNTTQITASVNGEIQNDK